VASLGKDRVLSLKEWKGQKKTFKEIEEPKRDILFKSKARIKKQKDLREPIGISEPIKHR
jgi:hypothetical protein